jgi:hypothetical protein
MATKKHFCNAVAWAACTGMFLPSFARADDFRPRPVQASVPAGALPATTITDVVLGADGMLVGQVLHAAGQPAVDTPVMVRQNGREVAATWTDSRGDFAIRGLRGGVYELSAGQSHGLYRLWAAQTEPPSAQRGVLIVAESSLARGQSPVGVLGYLMNPWVLATAASTAIAVPIALTNDKASSS